MASRPQRKAANIADFLQQRAKKNGWRTARTEIRPDGTLLIEMSMGQDEEEDHFLGAELRYGK